MVGICPGSALESVSSCRLAQILTDKLTDALVICRRYRRVL